MAREVISALSTKETNLGSAQFYMQLKRGQNYGVRLFQSLQDGLLSSQTCAQLNLPLVQVQELLRLGSVYLNEKRQNKESPIAKGDVVRVHTTPRRFDVKNLKAKDLIVFEDHEFVVINKPSGIPVHALVDNEKENILTALNLELGINLKVTSRLDVVTKGLLVFAKTEASQSQFNQELRARRVKKIYRATVQGHAPTGTYIHFMQASPKAPKVVQREPMDNGLRCELEVLESVVDGEKSYLKINLVTGRPHQIRAQLGFEGYPIAGDTIYGAGLDGSIPRNEIALECIQVSFLGREIHS